MTPLSNIVRECERKLLAWKRPELTNGIARTTDRKDKAYNDAIDVSITSLRSLAIELIEGMEEWAKNKSNSHCGKQDCAQG